MRGLALTLCIVGLLAAQLGFGDTASIATGFYKGLSVVSFSLAALALTAGLTRST